MDPFERIPIGDTGVTVTRLGLGSAPLGGNKAADGLYGGAVFDESLRIVNRAYEAGIRYFDTAPLYGWGKSEVRVGMGLAGRDRGSLTISTKAGRVLNPVSDGPRGPENLPELDAVFDYTRDGIRRSLDESLVRLDTDRVEILMLHDADQGGLEREGFETALPALVELREEGVVKAIGCGMNEWEMTSRFVRAFDLDFILLAGRYTLLEQGALDVFLPLCVERGVKIAVGGPYNSGILARDLDRPVSYNYEIAPQSRHRPGQGVGRGLPPERGRPQGCRNPVRRCASRRRDGYSRRYDPGRVGTESTDGAGANSSGAVGRFAFGKPYPPGRAYSLIAQVRFSGLKAVRRHADGTPGRVRRIAFGNRGGDQTCVSTGVRPRRKSKSQPSWACMTCCAYMRP